MKSKQTLCTLSELANFRNGKFISSTNYSEFGKFPIYGSNGKIANSNKCLNKNPVIVIGRVGAYCGSLHKINRPSWTTDNSIIAEPKDNIDFNFLYYKLKTLNLENLDTGSAQGLLTQNSLKTISTKIPAFREQKRIGQILEILDKKITILEKHNSILEKIIQSVFKSWFIDFDGQTEFVDSELGKIPKGWEIKKIIDIQSSKPHSTAMGPFGSNIKAENYVKFGIPVIRGKNIEKGLLNEKDFVFLTEKKATELRNSNAFPGDVIIIAQGNVGRVGFIPYKSKFKKYILSQNLMKITCNQNIVHPLYVYCYLKSADGQHSLLANVSRSGVPAIAQPLSYLRSIPILVPPIDVNNKFTSIVSQLVENISINMTHVNSLNKILEYILPKIMSGEIQV